MNDLETATPDRHETPKERIDRNLAELLQELRVALPGVQVLFAFLLILPFNQRFRQVTAFEEKVYFVTLLLAAAAAILFIAPTVHHRLQFRQDVKAEILRDANRSTIAGQAFLAAAMTGVVLLITDFLFSLVLTACVTTVTVAAFGWFWYLVPLRRLLRHRRSAGA
jgi:hypothetical protein